jgi:hypothetical protein
MHSAAWSKGKITLFLHKCTSVTFILRENIWNKSHTILTFGNSVSRVDDYVLNYSLSLYLFF